MASVPITVLLYDGPLLCGFNLAIKGLSENMGTLRTTWLNRTLLQYTNLAIKRR